MWSQVFTGKVVLVTGASRGIGSAIAMAFAQAGATVIGTATSAAGAKQISDKLQPYSATSCGKVLNVNEPDAINEVVQSIKKEVGPIQILINNAAVTQDNLLLRMKEDEWFNVINTDLTSVYRLAKLCLRDMLKAQGGRIINIGSIVGTIGNPGQVNYCAAKAGVLGLTKALALEVGSRHITVNTIAPGFIDTDMTEILTEEQRAGMLLRIPLQRAGRPEDIANMALFLASENAEYITGQTLHVNGGMFMS